MCFSRFVMLSATLIGSLCSTHVQQALWKWLHRVIFICSQHEMLCDLVVHILRYLHFSLFAPTVGVELFSLPFLGEHYECNTPGLSPLSPSLRPVVLSVPPGCHAQKDKQGVHNFSLLLFSLLSLMGVTALGSVLLPTGALRMCLPCLANQGG